MKSALNHFLVVFFYVQIISSASSQMRPLSTIESYVKLATGGFTILKALLNFFLSMNIAWVITSMSLLNRGRRYLFGIFSLGFLAEVVFVWLADHTLIVDSGMDDIEIVRDWARASAFVSLLLSFFVSCFLPPKKDDYSIKIDALLKSQMEFVSKLNAPSAMETKEEIVEFPVSTAAQSRKTAEVKPSEERRRSMTKMRCANPYISSSRSCKPRVRRSRSPYQSSLTELALPAVTPVKSRARANATIPAAASQAHYDNRPNYYIHPSDAIAKQEEEASRLELESLRALQKSAAGGASSGEETCSSSSDESASIDYLSAKRNKKRKVSEMYASSSEDSIFSSANDEVMSMPSAASDAPPSRIQEKKKCKLANV
mmetsp:Transcript_30597/g.57965  ORF Transcript_30597/g.57965 Transcript_30597/m.57965 type:complete len:372 (+) Transcript_30597:630-1745(+)